MSHATEDGHPTTLTLATRRPARFFMKIRGKPIMRRATERDFVFSIGPAESIDVRLTLADLTGRVAPWRK